MQALVVGFSLLTGPRETDLPVCSLAIPEGTVGKGALQAPPPDSTEAHTSW